MPEFSDSFYTFTTNENIKKARVFEVSAKSGDGVDHLFESIALNYILAKEAKRRASRSVLSSFKEGPLMPIIEEEERDNSQDPSYKNREIRRETLGAD